MTIFRYIILIFSICCHKVLPLDSETSQENTLQSLKPHIPQGRGRRRGRSLNCPCIVGFGGRCYRHLTEVAPALQNRVSELYSLVRFLRIYPYAYYFCNTGRSKASKKAKQVPCTCKSLDYSFKTNWRKCDHCG